MKLKGIAVLLFALLGSAYAQTTTTTAPPDVVSSSAGPPLVVLHIPSGQQASIRLLKVKTAGSVSGIEFEFDKYRTRL